MTVYVGVDLHSNNNYVGIVNQANEVLFKKRLANDLDTVLSVLEPFRNDVAGIAVESTFNWYWFVDGLMDNGYKVHLANPAAIQQYEGLKNIDDKRSAFWLANMLRLGILPTGYIYPKEERPIRDLLRKRLHLVRHRSSHILSIKNIMSRSLGLPMKSDEVKKLSESEVKKLFPEEYLFLSVNASVTIMRRAYEGDHRYREGRPREGKAQERVPWSPYAARHRRHPGSHHYAGGRRYQEIP